MLTGHCRSTSAIVRTRNLRHFGGLVAHGVLVPPSAGAPPTGSRSTSEVMRGQQVSIQLRQLAVGQSLAISRAAIHEGYRAAAVVRDTPSSAATALTAAPSAQASMIRDRSARACAVFRRRAHPSRTHRSDLCMRMHRRNLFTSAEPVIPGTQFNLICAPRPMIVEEPATAQIGGYMIACIRQG